MTLTEFEIVMLDNGEIALQRSGSDQPLVSISFSAEVIEYLGQHQVDVAKCMMDAGLQAFTDLNEESEIHSNELFEVPHTVH